MQLEAGAAASAAAEQLLAAAGEYKSGVSSLLDALERDVYSAAERCWRLQDRPVQLRGGLIRSKNVVLQEATFMPDVEQHELGGALDQWRHAVKSVAASAALQVLLAEQHLLAAVGRVLEQQEPAASSEQLLGLLGTLLSTHDALLALNQRDLRRTLALLSQLAAQVAAAWRRTSSGSPDELLAAHPAAPKEVLAVLTAPADAAGGAAGATPAPGLPSEQAASIAGLLERQHGLLEELSDAADVLRFWGRRSEKAAAGAATAEGREGDVPPMLTQAQQLLWAASQAYEEEQAAADLRTRQLVCQRYKPADLPALQARADDFSGGERLQAQQNLMFEPEFVELRGQARAQAARFLQDKGIAEAAEQLLLLRYLLLEAALPAETAPARQQLLLRVAEALLDGSTPPAAAPLLVGWLQEGLRRAEGGDQEAGPAQGRLSDHERARLVPMVCAAVAEPPGGGRAVLRPEEGAALLRSLLRPEAMLDEGRLDQFASTLKLVLDTCASAGVSAEASEALLAVFDASRLAVLACERAAAPDAPAGGAAGVQSLLSLAHAALEQPGGEACGLGLLEGVLALQPAAYFAATLQLALPRGGGGGGQRLLSMLCQVPAEMLPPAVVGDAFVQLAEALDGGTLAPPFLPHDLMGRLFRTPSVLQSMRVLVERGRDAVAAEAADAAAHGGQEQELWTVRLAASDASLQSAAAGLEGQVASGSGAPQAEGDSIAETIGGSAEGAPAAGAGTGGAGAGGSGSPGLLLLPLQASGEPLAVQLQRLVGAVLSCLLRRAGGAIDATTVSEELSALLEGLLLPAAEQGAWMLQWLWQCLYQELLRDFLRDLAPVDAGSAQLATSAFQSYWSSLPWQQARFHASSPSALAVLRLHLVPAAGDGAAATLLGKLDFTPVLAKAVPPARTTPRELDQVYSLTEEEEEEEDLLQAGPGGAGAWAAELGLLALQACVLVPAADQPAWLRQLLFGMRGRAPEAPSGGAGQEEEASVQALMQRSALSATMSQLLATAGEQQPLLPALLAGADWRRLAALVHAEEATAGGAAPWLLLPALLAGDSLAGGDLGSRLVHAASLLSRGAAQEGSSHAAETAASAAGPLLLCTLCQGARHEQRTPPPAAGRDASAAEDAALAAALAESARLAQQEQVVIPEGFPRELLEGTVEGQQLLLLQEQQEEQRQAELQRAGQQGGAAAGAADVAAAAAAGAGEQQALQQEEHDGGQQQEGQATQQQQQQQQKQIVEVQGCWSLTPDQHVALLQQALLPLAAARASNDAAGAWQQEDCPPELSAWSATAGLREWRAPHLADLMHAATAAAEAGPQAGERSNEAAADAAAAAAAAACVAAMLAPLVRAPVTVLLQDRLPFANSELPLDTESAVFVSVGPEGGASGAGGADAGVVRSQLLVAVLAACKQRGSDALMACLLRLLYACPALHASAAALQLSDALLCFMAAPEQDGGPLGQGAAAAAGVGADTAVASPGMLPAITATQGLPASALLGLAESAAQLHAPLTAALALERLRQGSTVLPKDEWQAQTTRVLQVALQAEASPLHPHDLVAVWLAALAWVADPRWRRLASGPHQAALTTWLEALELRVVALQLAQPEDFAPEGSGSAARRLLSGAADRFKSMRQHIPRLGPHQGQGHGQAEGAEHASMEGASGLPPEAAVAGTTFANVSGGSPPRDGPGSKEGQLGQRLSSGFRSLLGKAGGKPAGAAGGGAEAEGVPEPELQGAGERRKWGDKVRSRLAKMGLGGKGEQQGGEQHLHMAGEVGEGPGLPASMLQAAPHPPGGPAYAGPGLVTVAEEGGSFSAETSLTLHGTPGDVGHLGAAPGGTGGAAASERAGAVRQRLSSGLQAVGRGLSGGLSRVREKLSEAHHQGPRPDELAEHDREVACRIGLAAFAVSAYIKSVLVPSLTPRPDTSSPSTPTSARPPAEGIPVGPPTAAQRYYHRARSSFGSMQLDAEYMRELDRLIEARTELDALDSLAACPLLQRHPGRYQAFLAEAPQLLSAGAGVEAFQRRLQQLLFPGERQLAALA